MKTTTKTTKRTTARSPGGTKKTIDFSVKNPKSIGMQIRKLKLSADDIGKQLKIAEKRSAGAVHAYARGLLSTQKSKEQFTAETCHLLDTSLKIKPSSRRSVYKAVVTESGREGSLLIIQNISQLKKNTAGVCMKDLLRSGGSLDDVAEWMRQAGIEMRKLKAQDNGMLESGKKAPEAKGIIDWIRKGWEAIKNSIQVIIQAVIKAGESLANLVKRVAKWTFEHLRDFLAALITAGAKLIEFISAVFKWTYSNVAKFIKAALAVGYTIAQLLGTVITQSYYVMRRFICGIIKNLGPVGEIMDFILSKAGHAASLLWKASLQALRYARVNLIKVLNWMSQKTQMAIEAVIRAWEDIGEDLKKLYRWALTAGKEVWKSIGEATVKIGNSIYYVLNFLATSGVQFIVDLAKGFVRAGTAVAELIGWAVQQSFKICGEVILALFDAGSTIGQMLIDVVKEPGNALKIFIGGLSEIGKTVEDILHAAIIETSEQFLDEVLKTLMELEKSVEEILEATLRLGAASLTNVIALMFNMLGTYRPLNSKEIADAKTVFGNSINYGQVFMSVEDPLNKIIFGIQDFLNNNPDSRAFVTGNLINFDPSDRNLDRPTLIHEMTHVWQYREKGGIYLAEAVWAQSGGGDCTSPGYNYGYETKSATPEDSLNIESDYSGGTKKSVNLGCDLGKGGESSLQAANGNFNSFNPEQQGQILMHWFVRTRLKVTDRNGNPVNLDSSAWDPYQQIVFNS